MSFIDSIKESLGTAIPTEPLYRAVIFGENCAYFENIKGIISYSQEKISLSLKKGELVISGERLYIKQYCKCDAIICGKITSVERK